MLVFVLISPTSQANGANVFFDDFDSEIGSGDGASMESGLNYANFANWTVSSGTVDLLAQGDFGGINCANSSGKCVDLDGGNQDAGVMTSSSISLVPGVYQISFDLAGAPSVFGGANAAEPNTVDVAVGSFYSDQITRNQGDPFESFGGQFTVDASTTVEITFSNQGGDNFGALVDNVVLAVPEPDALPCLAALSLMALVLSGRINPLALKKQNHSIGMV